MVYQYVDPFAGSGTFTCHLYSGRPCKECKSKMQVVYIHFFYINANNISWELFKRNVMLHIWNHIKFFCTHSVIFLHVISTKTAVLQSATVQVKHIKLVSVLRLCAEQTLHFWYPLQCSCAPRNSKPRFLLVMIYQSIPPCYIGIHTCLVYWAYIRWK